MGMGDEDRWHVTCLKCTTDLQPRSPYDSRNSNSLNLTYINCNFKNALTKLCFQFSLYYCTLQIRFLFTPVNHALLSFNSCIFKVLPCILKPRKKGHSTTYLFLYHFYQPISRIIWDTFAQAELINQAKSSNSVTVAVRIPQGIEYF